MVDTPANQAPVKDDVIAHLYGRKGATSGDGFVKYAENQFAHAVGLSASDKGKTPYVDANGDMARLTIGSNGAIKYVASGLPAWLGPGTASQLLRMNAGATAPEWATIATSLVQISKQTISSPVSQVSFTSIPASGYSKFLLVINGLVSAVAATTDQINIEVSTDNGSTWKTTSGDYYNGTTARTRLLFFSCAGSTSTFQYGAVVAEMIGLGNAGRATSGLLMMAHAGISNTNISVNAANEAARIVAEADNAFRVRSNGGSNLTAGTIVLYGMIET